MAGRFSASRIRGGTPLAGSVSMDRESLWSFVVALFIGALIGTERTLRHRPERGDFAGLRTFILLAQAGAITAWIAEGWDAPVVFVVGMAGTALMLATAYFVRSRSEPDPPPGYTTEIAGSEMPSSRAMFSGQVGPVRNRSSRMSSSS